MGRITELKQEIEKLKRARDLAEKFAQYLFRGVERSARDWTFLDGADPTSMVTADLYMPQAAHGGLLAVASNGDVLEIHTLDDFAARYREGAHTTAQRALRDLGWRLERARAKILGLDSTTQKEA